jgi:hypothetical protein
MTPDVGSLAIRGLHEAAGLAPEGTVRPIDDNAADDAKSFDAKPLMAVTMGRRQKIIGLW